MAVRCPNVDLDPEGPGDHLHHFGIPNDDIKWDHFKDVKFVLCGGSAQRMTVLASHTYKLLKSKLPNEPEPENLSRTTRFVLYKFGPIIFVSHGMGNASLSIMLNEILKLLFYAKCKDVTLIRCGTCGGIGVEPGSLVISTQGLNGELKPSFDQYVLGKRTTTNTDFPQDLAQELYETAQAMEITATKGKTMSTDGFYEEQGRKNGLFCTYNPEETQEFISRLHQVGVRNIEMESTCLASLCARAGVRAAIICVALVNRLKTDVVHCEPDELHEWESLPGKVVTRFLEKYI